MTEQVPPSPPTQHEPVTVQVPLTHDWPCGQLFGVWMQTPFEHESSVQGSPSSQSSWLHEHPSAPTTSPLGVLGQSSLALHTPSLSLSWKTCEHTPAAQLSSVQGSPSSQFTWLQEQPCAFTA